MKSDWKCYSIPRNCSKANDLTGICTGCNPTFQWNNAAKSCSCIPGQFYLNVTINATNTTNATIPSCGSCQSTCLNCSNATGCISCKSSYIKNKTNGQCYCNATSVDLPGQGCVLFKKCPTAQYNLGNNTCKSCDIGCTTCLNYTGECT
jgi:hypothetical protein